MQYRKNIITGDWIICGNLLSHNNNGSPLFESYTAKYPQNMLCEQIDTPLFPMSYEHFLSYFKNYLNCIDAILKQAPDTYIFSISKKHAEVFEKNFESEMIFAPAQEKFLDKSVIHAEKFYDKKQECLFCRIIREEINIDKRIILRTKEYIVFEPFGSRFPYETCIMPLEHIPSFRMLNCADLQKLAKICSLIIPEIYNTTCQADFIIHIHHINVPSRFNHCLHWYMQIIPFMNNWAGFEIATSMNINSITPEDCALEFRKNC
ncbi:hypothetical protein J7L67_04490 [bacterium]|nr:hypothetical protein [bacterium]